jgi:ABC-type nitrate/sulfonate/bicarbonate transport system permease component
MHVCIRLWAYLFKLDLVMMAIVILCILSAALYQGIAILERRKL